MSKPITRLMFYPATRTVIYDVLRIAEQLCTSILKKNVKPLDAVLDQMEASEIPNVQTLLNVCSATGGLTITASSSDRIVFSTPQITMVLIHKQKRWLMILNKFETPSLCATYLEPLESLDPKAVIFIGTAEQVPPVKMSLAATIEQLKAS